MRLKALHKKNLVKAKNIIADSITNHLIRQVYSLKTRKEILLFLDQAILREEHKSECDQLKNVKIENVETI